MSVSTLVDGSWAARLRRRISITAPLPLPSPPLLLLLLLLEAVAVVLVTGLLKRRGISATLSAEIYTTIIANASIQVAQQSSMTSLSYGCETWTLDTESAEY